MRIDRIGPRPSGRGPAKVTIGVVTLLLVGSTAAVADKKIVDMTPLYRKEATACASQLNGLVKVVTGAKTLAVDAAEKDALARDIVQLEKAVVVFEDYCKQTADMKAFLEENAKTAYKKVEREIDTRDNSIRKLRKDTKKLVLEIQPITRKMIPRIAQQAKGDVTAPPTEDKRVPGKFPSGRIVELPTGMAGTWRLSGNANTDTASYHDKATTATIHARGFTSATCDQQRKSISAKPADQAELDLTDLPHAKAVAWVVRYVRREKAGAHLTTVACVPKKGGGVLVTANIQPDTAPITDEVTRLALRMLARN